MESGDLLGSTSTVWGKVDENGDGAGPWCLMLCGDSFVENVAAAEHKLGRDADAGSGKQLPATREWSKKTPALKQGEEKHHIEEIRLPPVGSLAIVCEVCVRLRARARECDQRLSQAEAARDGKRPNKEPVLPAVTPWYGLFEHQTIRRILFYD
jgi:hypothetical protein